MDTKKCLTFLSLLMVLLLAGCGKRSPDTSVLQDCAPSDDFEIYLTDEFTEIFKEIDYKKIYNSKTDAIVIHYSSPTALSSFTEEQYAINYYTVRSISGEEAGYIGACAEEIAWRLWGSYDSGIRPTIWSEYEQKGNPYECLYFFGYQNNFAADEFGDLYYYDKFPVQQWSDLSVTAGPSVWEELQGTEIDPTSPSPVYAWEEEQKNAMYNSYIETRNYLNKDAIEKKGAPVDDRDTLQIDNTENIVIAPIIKDNCDLSTINTLTFLDFDTKQEATIYSLPQVNNLYRGEPVVYARVDLDSNGSEELLVQYDVTGDTAIITMGGNCTAYYAPYRGIRDLKTDGTMCGSGSAFEGSIHRISFSDKGIEYQDIITYDSGEISGKEKYILNGKEIDKEAFSEQMQLQYEKENVVWIEICDQD